VFKKRAARARGWIWIDQLCIDQESALEKNHQVGLMQEIYRGASATFMWLGDGQTPEIGFNAIRKTASQPSETDERLKYYQNELSKSEREAVEAVRELPYWSRHWIAQEVILSVNPIVLCGQAELDWRTFEAVVRHGYWSRSDAFLRLRNMEAVRSALDRLFFHFIAEFAAHSLCQDPRDKIFGAQSLFSESKRLEVDYNLPTRVVFLRVVALEFRDLIGKLTSDGFDSFVRNCLQLAKGMELLASNIAKDEIRVKYEAFHRARVGQEITWPPTHSIVEIDEEDILVFLDEYVLQPKSSQEP
jgi:hypothetical protein